jgi:gluconokinase
MTGRLPPVVVMGVSGCGKTAVGTALAQALGATFVEGDRLHPLENVARMSAGIPLTDADRAGWLDAIGTEMAAHAARGSAVVAACSALKRRYRDALRAQLPAAVFVHLRLEPALARMRVGMRRTHFMPASLVESQFAALEPPEDDEAALELDASRPVEDLVREAGAWVRGAVID